MATNPAAARTCPICDCLEVVPFFEMRGVPVLCNRLWPTRAEALRAPAGDILLGLCSECNHIFNLSFDPSLVAYGSHYENALHFSPRFREHENALADRLIERHDLHGRTVVELGCGDGHFLRTLCERGQNRGIGFDPGAGARMSEPHGRAQVEIIADSFSERYADCEPDFVCCQHVLEHVAEPRQFMRQLRRALVRRSGVRVSFEVPSLAFMLRTRSIWDVIYEHCSYFSRRSLVRLFEGCDFAVLDVREEFEGQFLSIEAQTGAGPALRRGLDEHLSGEVAGFADAYRGKLRSWEVRLRERVTAGQHVALWGSGSKGVMFLNRFPGAGQITCVVDVNPRKQGAYVPGTGHQVVAPPSLCKFPPDAVVVMNPIYEGEISEQLRGLGIRAEMLSA